MRQPILAACLLAWGVLIAFPDAAQARIKLITLPARERVEIQLDHPDVTLVEEERIVPLVKGANQIDFSWANTQIDPDTIVFRVLPRGEPKAEAKAVEAKVLSVSYPPKESALVWQVSASDSGSARVRISYVLGNLSKSFSYRAVASHDEKTLTLTEYIRIRNLANESFDSTGLWAGFGPRFLRPIGVNETKELLIEKYANAPFTKTYTADAQRFGYLDRVQNKLMVPMHYVIKNDKASKLGRAPLQYGKVRVFAQDAHGGVAFLGEDWGKFTPLDDEMRLFVGTSQDVVVKRTIDRNEQKRITGNLYNREVVVKYEIENFKDKAAALDVSEGVRALRNEVGGDTGRDVEWELGKQTTFKGGRDKEKSTADQAVFHVPLPPRAEGEKVVKVIHKLHILIKNEW